MVCPGFVAEGHGQPWLAKATGVGTRQALAPPPQPSPFSTSPAPGMPGQSRWGQDQTIRGRISLGLLYERHGQPRPARAARFETWSVSALFPKGMANHGQPKPPGLEPGQLWLCLDVAPEPWLAKASGLETRQTSTPSGQPSLHSKRTWPAMARQGHWVRDQAIFGRVCLGCVSPIRHLDSLLERDQTPNTAKSPAQTGRFGKQRPLRGSCREDGHAVRWRASEDRERSRGFFFGLVENACGGVPPALVSAGLLEEKQYRKGPTTTTLSQVN